MSQETKSPLCVSVDSSERRDITKRRTDRGNGLCDRETVRYKTPGTDKCRIGTELR